MGGHTFKSIRNRLRYQFKAALYYLPWFVLFALLFFAPWCCSGTELSFQRDGTILQVLGVATVAIGIRRTRQDLGSAGLWKQLRTFLSYPPPTTGSVFTALGNATVRGRGHISGPRPGANATVDEIAAWVEKKINESSNEMKVDLAEVRENIRDQENKLAAEINDRAAIGAEVQKLKQVTTSGLNISAYGVVCLAIGIVYGTMSPDLHALWGAI